RDHCLVPFRLELPSRRGRCGVDERLRRFAAPVPQAIERLVPWTDPLRKRKPSYHSLCLPSSRFFLTPLLNLWRSPTIQSGLEVCATARLRTEASLRLVRGGDQLPLRVYRVDQEHWPARGVESMVVRPGSEGLLFYW